MIGVDNAEWLASQDPDLHRARSPALAERLIASLPPRPRILGLGSDTANLFQFLAPRIARAQAWTLIEADEERLGDAFRGTADWAAQHGWTVTWPGRALVVHTRSGAWRIEGIVQDVIGGSGTRFGTKPDAMVCEALLHGLSAATVKLLAGSIRSPFFACRTPDGHDTWMPRHPADAVISAGLRHNRRAGAVLGTSASGQVIRAFAEFGFIVRSESAGCYIPRTASATASTLVRHAAAAASAALPLRRSMIEAWEEMRLRQVRQGRLAIRIGHRDILAVPR